jgi:predicted enzyme involved in methoxymalonyl-ACP biosynthesis
MIARRQEEKGIIDSLLLSCRILSRRLEFLFLEYCLKKLSSVWRITKWEAEYIQTEKNMQIPDFLVKAGFQLCTNNIYILQMNHWNSYNVKHIKIKEESTDARIACKKSVIPST